MDKRKSVKQKTSTRVVSKSTPKQVLATAELNELWQKPLY